jgi:putative transposase
MAERGISGDHATIHRWVFRYTPELLKCFNSRKRPVTVRWHVDETYIKVRGRWMCVDAPCDARKIITYDLGTVIGC